MHSHCVMCLLGVALAATTGSWLWPIMLAIGGHHLPGSTGCLHSQVRPIGVSCTAIHVVPIDPANMSPKLFAYAAHSNQAVVLSLATDPEHAAGQHSKQPLLVSGSAACGAPSV